MRGRDWFLSLAGPVDVKPVYRAVDWSDVLLHAEQQRDPAGWLSEQMGVTRRTGNRYLGAVRPGVTEYQVQPTRGATAERALQTIGRIQRADDLAAEAGARDQGNRVRRARIARVLRGITTVDVGRVAIVELSGVRAGDDGERSVGVQDVDLGSVADLVDKGRWEAAEEQLSGTIMDAYGDGDPLGDILEITDYPGGIQWD